MKHKVKFYKTPMPNKWNASCSCGAGFEHVRYKKTCELWFRMHQLQSQLADEIKKDQEGT